MQVVEVNSQNCYIPFMTGKSLKEKRGSLGISQQKLSQLLELSLSTIARWEQLEEKEIPNSRLLELALKTVERDMESQSKNN